MKKTITLTVILLGLFSLDGVAQDLMFDHYLKTQPEYSKLASNSITKMESILVKVENAKNVQEANHYGAKLRDESNKLREEINRLRSQNATTSNSYLPIYGVSATGQLTYTYSLFNHHKVKPKTNYLLPLDNICYYAWRIKRTKDMSKALKKASQLKLELIELRAVHYS
ncbi:MAG: hypothetical protein CL840_12605 [Crocinitomicaceae bacterium]|nr:hypothetical protein [Crocinitomicaceae bacterium]|tara:strand:- start:3906 stop:4412 length:507 start_codon:yes stop_codon:yes gene_type:complete